MCGIVGIVSGAERDQERAAIVRRMAATLEHRGPDDEGYASPKGCDLGFRRLSIIDLDAPSPPYSNEDRTVWSVTNGQIYNAAELRPQLQARGHTLTNSVDTEVVHHLFEDHGPALVDSLNGMFALAVWDETTRTLLLARDRTGEKPLYYWHHDGELVFASELRAILAHPRMEPRVDPVALRRFLLHDYFPAPLCPIHGVRKLAAGQLLVFRGGELTTKTYWDLADHFASPALARRSIDDLCEELDARIATAVERRRRSDVQVGVFLSGGIDSSTVLAHLSEQLGDGVPAFSIGHQDLAFDESRFARDTAAAFGAEYHELVLSESDLEDGLRRVCKGFDEPLGDASIIPTHLLARFARERVKVVLSGEGADELFAGYPTYIGDRVAEGYRRLPPWLRRSLVGAARKMAPVSMGNVGMDYLISRFASNAALERVERHHGWFGSIHPDRHHEVLSPAMLAALGDDDPFASARSRLEGRDLPDGLSQLLYTDFSMYLQDDLLTKVDRASMLTSLEARAPFLDHDLAEFAAGLPSKLKLAGLKKTKAILKRAVRDRLPADVLSRRKRGFNIPFSRWLLHGLGDRLRDRFAPERIETRGLLGVAGFTRLLDEHMHREADHRKPLFTLLVLDMWCDKVFGDGAPVPIAADSSARELP